MPQLLDWDDELLVIEMTVVGRPFLLDFADSYLDEAPEFPAEVLEQWHDEKVAEFGEELWKRVQLVMYALRGSHGIYLLDVNRGNIAFGEGED